MIPPKIIENMKSKSEFNYINYLESIALNDISLTSVKFLE